MNKLDEVIAELRGDTTLQRDLRNPLVFGLLVSTDHNIPSEFQPTFEKLLRLHQACEQEEVDFSVDLITPHPSLDKARKLDFSPQLRQRRTGGSTEVCHLLLCHDESFYFVIVSGVHYKHN
jgi:hypothetical protein